MKSVFIVLTTLLAIAGFGYLVLINEPNNGGSLIGVFFLLASLVAIGALAVNGYLENLKATVWMLGSGVGAYWTGRETVRSIDFDAPFLISFYWSTVGYFLLTLVLFIATVFLLIKASKKPEILSE